MQKKPTTWRFEDVTVGFEIEPVSFRFTIEDSNTFGKLSGDVNPLHTDASFARKKGYKKQVVHGMLLASKFSYLVGMLLPGRDCLYISQDIRFHKPIYSGEECVLSGKVLAKSESTRLLEIQMDIFDKNRIRAVTGIAKVKVI